MTKIQKTFDISVKITVEIEENLIGSDAVDDAFKLADNVAYGLQYMNEAGELFRDGDVKEYSAVLEKVEYTNYQYNQ